MKITVLTTCLLAGALLATVALPARAQNPQTGALTLAERGQSRFSILVAPDAPQSAKTAAGELQHYIEKSTKAKLPLLTDNQTPKAPFISVGDTAAARAEGLSAQGMEWESYRIVTRGPNIFIFGPDTADGEKTKQGGTSKGTANGVYTFLEDYLNIRWLMPGEMGEDVPSLAAVAVPAVDRTEAPVFQARRVTHTQTAPEVTEWENHQKLGYSLATEHNHSWARTVPPELYETHPEWFPLVNGKRIPPVHVRYKIETTNPELVKYFAEYIKSKFREDPNLYMVSMSPSDGSSDPLASWSKSKETLALMETDPNGRPSHTKLMLKFYNDIAKIVAQEFPDRYVGGYIYESYIYPPKDGVPKLEPNLFITVATSPSYGYKAYRPEVKAAWADLMDTWSAQTQNIGYYDLFTWLRYSGAAIAPPAPEIMNFVFPRLVKDHVKATYIYGTEDWSHGGPTNYTLARMSWNPQLDAREVNNEFYRRGYGEAAAPAMQQLYEMVDAAVKKHYIGDNKASFNLRPEYMKEVLAANYPEIERLYLAAQAAQKADTNTTPEQKARLNFFGDNMILMNYRLQKMGAIPKNDKSPFYRSQAVIEAMSGQVQTGFGVKLGYGWRPDFDDYNWPPRESNGLRKGVNPATVPVVTEKPKSLMDADKGAVNADAFE